MSGQTESRFSNRDDLDQLGEYKRFNVAAVLSLIFGVGSAGALLHPNVWVVPGVGIFLGLVGLALTRRSDDLGGRWIAWAGIALCLFFVSWAAAQIIVTRQVVYSEAAHIGKQWLQQVTAGEAEIAHQGMLHPASRQASGLSVDDYYQMDAMATEDKQAVFSSPPASELLGLGSDAHIRLLRNVTQDIDLQYGKLILQVYRVSAARGEPIDVQLTITRSYKEDLGRATWIVADIGPPD